MKRVIMMDEDDYKEIVIALENLRVAVKSLEPSYIAGELGAQLERIENVIFMEKED